MGLQREKSGLDGHNYQPSPSVSGIGSRLSLQPSL